MENANPPDVSTPRTRWGFVDALLFVLGAGAFVVVNAFVYLVAHPGWPNPGSQSDVRLPLLGIAAVVALIAVLRRPGRRFATGFVSGFFLVTVFMGSCTTQWFTPGGTARQNAVLASRLDASHADALVRARKKWVEQMRTRGLDEAIGVRRAFTVIDCAARHLAKHGDYPRPRWNAPDTDQCVSTFSWMETDDAGWRITYRPVADSSARVTGFRVRITPDSALHVDGPVIESDESGLVTIRAHRGEPAHVRGSPLPAIVETLVPCIRTNVLPYSIGMKDPVTLTDLVFQSREACNGPVVAETIKSDPDSSLSYNPNAARLVILAPGFERYNTAAVYNLLYVPRGKRPLDGYDLYAWPMRYGDSGLRSYLLSGDEIHVTTENRRATASDPLAPACEIHPVPCAEGR
jgi:hypothetical protein